MTQTVLLGVTYQGRPMFQSLALMLEFIEQRDGREAAQRMLDAHNKARECFGNPPIDLASQFTTANPMSMAACSPNALAALEGLVEVEERKLANGRHSVAA